MRVEVLFNVLPTEDYSGTLTEPPWIALGPLSLFERKILEESPVSFSRCFFGIFSRRFFFPFSRFLKKLCPKTCIVSNTFTLSEILGPLAIRGPLSEFSSSGLLFQVRIVAHLYPHFPRVLRTLEGLLSLYPLRFPHLYSSFFSF